MRLDVSQEWQYTRYVPSPDFCGQVWVEYGFAFLIINKLLVVWFSIMNKDSLECASPLAEKVNFYILKLVYIWLLFYKRLNFNYLKPYSRSHTYSLTFPMTLKKVSLQQTMMTRNDFDWLIIFCNQAYSLS